MSLQAEWPALAEAERLVRETGKASFSMLQRRMKIGYLQACSLINGLEEAGIVGPIHADGHRDVLPTKETQ